MASMPSLQRWPWVNAGCGSFGSPRSRNSLKAGMRSGVASPGSTSCWGSCPPSTRLRFFHRVLRSGLARRFLVARWPGWLRRAGRAGRLRCGAPAAVRSAPLGRNGNRSLLERLYGRGGTVGWSRRPRGAGSAVVAANESGSGAPSAAGSSVSARHPALWLTARRSSRGCCPPEATPNENTI